MYSSKIKRIVYFVGASGCGKSTKVRRLRQTFGNNYQYVIEDDIMANFLDQTSVFMKYLHYLHAIWNRIIIAIKNTDLYDHKIIFIDGHPILSVIYAQALYKLHNGHLISLNDVKRLTRCHDEIIRYMNKKNIFEGINQTVYYINLPLELNLELLRNRNKGLNDIDETEKKYLLTLREIIHSQIFDLVERLYKTEVVEVNTLDGLDIINMYLLGPGPCC